MRKQLHISDLDSMYMRLKAGLLGCLQAEDFPWQQGWAGPDGQPSIAQNAWHAIICCNGEAEMTFASS